MKTQKGQALTEYLILVAILAVGALGITRILGQTLNKQLTNVTYAIQGQDQQVSAKIKIEQSLHNKKDLSNFFDNAASQ